jgi:protein-tyrosine phosphatase
MQPQRPIRVMMICTGNICRSPMAEAIFRHLVKEAGLEDRFEIASSGTDGWHVGERPHRGTQNVLRQHHVALDPAKRAQRITTSDLETYDYLVAMDSINLAALSRAGRAIPRLLDFASGNAPADVPDPYYDDNFEYVYQLVTDGCRGLLRHIREQEGI